MIEFCILVSGIIGAWCFSAPPDFALPGDCVDIGDVFMCRIDANELPIRATYYNPELGETNCMEPCDQLGDGTAVVDGYGRFTACPIGWYGRHIEFTKNGVPF